LAVQGGPALLDRLDQAGGAVRDNEHRRAEAAADQVAATQDLPQPVLGFRPLPSRQSERIGDV
jgi:hypothetical protein